MLKGIFKFFEMEECRQVGLPTMSGLYFKKIQKIPSNLATLGTDYGHTMDKFLILCGPNPNFKSQSQ